MSIQSRITFSTEDIITQLEQFLDTLRRFQYDNKYQLLLGSDLLNHIRNWDNSIRARRKDPFTIVIAGEFKRGKSSFINAYLGEKVAPTDVTPETVTLNSIQYGVHKNEAVLSRGRRITLSDEELTRSALEKLMNEIGEPIRRLDLWRPNERLKDIRIIDTPGMNDVSGDFEPMLAEALAQADAVIYLYSVTYPLSRTEQVFLKYSILPQNYTKLFLVGNYADLIDSQEDLERMQSFLKDRTQHLLPNESTYLVSALDEFCRITGNTRPKEELEVPLAEHFNQLRGDIEELIEQKKTVIVADRMLHMGEMMCRELEDDLSNLEKGMKMDSAQLERERSTLEAEKASQIETHSKMQARVDMLIGDMKSETDSGLRNVLSKLESEDLSSFPVEDIYQYYSYYVVDVLQSTLRTYLEQHRETMLEEMSQISDDLSKNLAGSFTTNDKFAFRLMLDNSTWTKGDSVTLAINVFGGSFIGALADLAGSMIRKNELESDKGNILIGIREKFPSIRKAIEQHIDTQYNSLGTSAKKALTEHYGALIQRSEDVVEQYFKAARKSDEEKAQTAAAIEELRIVLASIQDLSI